MTSESHIAAADPSGVSHKLLTPQQLRGSRTSIKWTRHPEEVLPLFVAEMDYTIAPVVQQAIIDRVLASDLGYLDGPGPLATVFADFAHERWGWHVSPEFVFIATDVSCGVVEPLRLGVPAGGRIALSTPTYPGFFEMFQELDAEIVQIPLSITHAPGHDGAHDTTTARLDLSAIERAFQADPGIDAFVLCNPHNPHGLVHSEADLTKLAQLAAAHDVFVVSDEIHAPLTHHGSTFVPFGPLAATAGALSVTSTSASKGWNLAGAKCAVIVAADARAQQLLQQLPPEVACRASILGLYANIAAFRDGVEWLDRAISQIEDNSVLLSQLVTEHLPGVRCTTPTAGYLAWLDFGPTPLAPSCETEPRVHERILREARVALGQGEGFGVGGAHHVRINLAVAPDTIREAVHRIAPLFTTAHSLDEMNK